MIRESFVLFAFGGAGPVHASRYTADLGIKQVVIPLTASVHGATGLISSDVLYEYGKIGPPDRRRSISNGSSEIFHPDRAGRVLDLESRGFKAADIEIVRSLDTRLPLSGARADALHASLARTTFRKRT